MRTLTVSLDEKQQILITDALLKKAVSTIDSSGNFDTNEEVIKKLHKAMEYISLCEWFKDQQKETN